ncbi:response regulator [Deinococcus peraridilitoris]|uniref:CheY-like receiver domain-containing protein n=1 Tax=Deinococcus peraridilitoris (strain DSM 19664 / LMG 22246 / CIP 109416 / KR-200) TaxID=937777 RepID=L0A2R9_DEIPD|nr:response regulator [Deinococcus peraridilitoris]AFZ67492.1 CheY-like receiver domain-containing protein [Deinococcus peraridilitoris DSM 19664]
MIDILLVDDSEADVMLTQLAFEEARMANRLHVTRDGVEALEFLRRQGPFQDAPTPDVILLDLNMPRMNGLEVLEELKSHDVLRNIPVVVLTTSQAEADVWRSYNLHANAYIPKPVSLPNFLDVVRSFENFWLAVVKLSPKGYHPPSEKHDLEHDT